MIRRNHSLGSGEARRRVVEVAIELANRFNLNYAWDGDNLGFHGSGVDGNIAVGDDRVEIQVKLGFALMMLQGAVRQAIESAIDGHLES